ncbi:MAG: glycosyltransferase family 9 protein, partial [Planctomycetota bacterium]
MTGEPQRILVLEAGGIGDAVMATPALDALRRRFPHARIAAVATPRAAPVLASLDLGIELRTLRLGRRLGGPLDAARLVLAGRTHRPDLLIDLSSIETDAAARRR